MDLELHHWRSGYPIVKYTEVSNTSNMNQCSSYAHFITWFSNLFFNQQVWSIACEDNASNFVWFCVTPTIYWDSVHLISICSIRWLIVLFMDIHFLNREYVVDLVGEPGNIHGPDSSINGGFQSSMPSPLHISHLKEFQEPYVESYLNHQTVGSKQICGFPENPLRSGLLALRFPWMYVFSFSTGLKIKLPDILHK